MEILGIALIVIACFIMFKSSIKKVNKAIEDNITVEIMEGNSELYSRAQQAYNDLIDTCGANYHTPEELYAAMQKKRNLRKNNNE